MSPAVLELDRDVAGTVTAVDAATGEVAVNVAEVAPAATVTEAASAAAFREPAEFQQYSGCSDLRWARCR